MGQLIVIALVAAAAWFGWKTYRRGAARMAADRRETVARQRATTLERDPDTGVYREPGRRPPNEAGR